MCYFDTSGPPKLGAPKTPTGNWGTTGTEAPTPSSPTNPSPSEENATQVEPGRGGFIDLDRYNRLGLNPPLTTKKSSIAPTPSPLGTFALRLGGFQMDATKLKNPFKIGP